jgi:phage head maturation protease
VLETAGTRPLLHRAAGDGGMPTLFGYFSVWDEFTEIDSTYEGRFLERVATGAFERSIRERRDQIRVLFQHGSDPFVGNKPLGPLLELREDAKGAGYVVPLLDTTYNRDPIPGLEQGLYQLPVPHPPRGVRREAQGVRPQPRPAARTDAQGVGAL